MFRKLLNVFRPNRLDADLREELEFHYSQTSGSFGNRTLVQDRMRDASTVAWLETFLQDLRYGFRQLRRAPVLLATAVLSLALGIGANTAIFTLINAVMLQSLPVKDPGQLVLFNDDISTGVYDGDKFGADEFSSGFYTYLQQHNDSLESLCAFRQGTDRVVMHVAGSAGAWERARVHLISGNYFGVLGVRAAVGRVLQPSDDATNAPRAAVLSYPFWRDRFRSDPAVLGQTVILSGSAFTVVGVAAGEFFGERIETAPDLWLPLSFQPEIMQRESFLTAHNVYWLNCIGRLKPGVSLATAQASVTVKLHQFFLHQVGTSVSASTRRKIEAVHVHLKPGGAGISGLRYRYSQPLHLLMAVVAIVLLIACANVATLLLARSSARRSEFLARLALGASRTRLLRQVLTESVLLSFIGGVAGIAVAWWSVRILVLVLHVSSVVKVEPNFTVLGFTFALCVANGILFGIFPALRLSQMEPRPGNVVTPAAGAKRRFNSGQALVILQIALSLSLLIGAGLLAHSLLALEGQNLGFQRDKIFVLRTDASLAGYKEGELYPLYRRLSETLSRLPHVVLAGVGRFTPESGNVSSGNFSLEGYPSSSSLNMDVYDVPVGPGFLETLNVPLILGRTISLRDTPASPAVAVVNQSFVNLYLPNQNAIGRHMALGSPFKAPGAEIVGVVADSRFYDLREKAPPMVFFSLWQKPTPAFEAIFRVTTLAGIPAELRKALGQIDSRLPVLDLETLDSQVESNLDQQKLLTSLCSVFGLLALTLATIGIYGTLAYSVAGRTGELGIRMALGAQRRNVVFLILRDSFWMIGIGLVVGLPIAIGGTHWLKSFLFGITELDPLAIGCSLLLILASALLASYLPARRAAGIDPLRALRHE